MKSVKITGQKRETIGKKSSKKLRNQGLVPAVIYGINEVAHITVPFSEIRKLVYTPNVYIIELDIDGEEHRAIIQDVQWHPVEEQILHIDFLKVYDDKPISVVIPIVLNGQAKGVKSGGRLKTNMRKLRIKALPKNLPDTVEIDITKLAVGDSIKVEELKRENLEFQDNKSNLIVGVISSRAAMAAMELPEEEEDEAAEGEEGAEGETAEGAEGTEGDESSEE
ncbi:MAG TPA: 50S ribosomal protein L25/general stress protein Ctc [Prolixibacteraceae bacterium]|nr:50S ribosomal protein L25/general stress protein Ctc [Prolixibacteraceae bacterium]